jgi:hypothetical protein
MQRKGVTLPMTADTNGPDEELPLLRDWLPPGAELHLVLGTPWKQALSAAMTSDSDFGWKYPEFSKGDFVLTVLDTKPRSFMLLEMVVSSPGIDKPEVGGLVLFPELPRVSDIGKRLGLRLPAAPTTLDRGTALRLLDALEASQRESTTPRTGEGKRSPNTTRARSSWLQAHRLLASQGLCAACQRNFAALPNGAGIAGLEVHHLDALGKSDNEFVNTESTRLAVLCGACHSIVHASGMTPDGLRAAWAATST